MICLDNSVLSRFASPTDYPRVTQYLSANSDVPWTIEFIGDGPGMEACKARVREVGLWDRVTFSGRRDDVAERLAYWGVTGASEFLAVTADPRVARAHGLPGPTLEGYLFPATYELAQHTPPEDVVDRLVRAFRRQVMPLLEEHPGGLAALKRDFGWDLHDVVTLASIVEKEAAVREERPVIAGVFLNRLRSPDFRPKRLQADPTVAYGCLAAPGAAPSCAGFDGTITRSMTDDPQNPYNTYRIERLPPGPIANPGAGAIEAVLAPAAHDYLYFVARGGRRHHFSASHEEHVRAAARYRASQGD